MSFIDERIELAEWNDRKATFPKGGLPCWREPGVEFNETNALARFLSKKVGIYPMDNLKAWDVDATFDFLYEQWGKMAAATFNKKMDEETELAYLAATDKVILKMSKKLEREDHKDHGFLCGDDLTVCDFQMAHIMWTYWKNEKHSCGDFYTSKCQAKLAENKVMEHYIHRLEKKLEFVLA